VISSVDSYQLDLFEGELEAIRRLPWGGVSPRALTRGHLAIIFKPQGDKSTSAILSDPAQYEIWPANEVPWRYAGAPSIWE